MDRVEFFFDPQCPWTWMTSRWVVEVAPQRGVPVRWRTFSLNIKEAELPPDQREHQDPAPLQALRVIEAVWAQLGDEPIGRLYSEIGQRFHVERDRSLDALGAALLAAGLDADYLSEAGNERWDDEIRGSMSDALACVGDDVGVPILVFHDGDRVYGLSGPVMSPAPTGDRALELWDLVAGLAGFSDVFELKRSRTRGPALT